MKRVLTIQDLSCMGKCSLQAALPVLSVMGVEAVPLPTAVLSGHTAFEHCAIRDMTEFMPEIVKAWEAEQITFDAICSGYLGSARQVDIVDQLGSRLTRIGSVRFVDPAMADHGRLYSGLTEEHVLAMKKMCCEADVIVPNITEGCMLTGTAYMESPSQSECREILKRLAGLGAKKVILTGYSGAPGRIGAACYERGTDEFFVYENEALPVRCHGTGDLFAAAAAGALMRGWTLHGAITLAVDFTRMCIQKTLDDPEQRWYGTSFELALGWLMEQTKQDG